MSRKTVIAIVLTIFLTINGMGVWYTMECFKHHKEYPIVYENIKIDTDLPYMIANGKIVIVNENGEVVETKIPLTASADKLIVNAQTTILFLVLFNIIMIPVFLWAKDYGEDC